MPSSTSRPASGEAHDPRRVLALWTGLLTGPLAWLALLEFNYAFAYVACETREKWFLHLATIVAAALVAAAGAWAWRAGNDPFEPAHRPSPPLSAATCDSRSRWMAYAAAVSSAWFIIVIFAMEVPLALLEVCQ